MIAEPHDSRSSAGPIARTIVVKDANLKCFWIFFSPLLAMIAFVGPQPCWSYEPVGGTSHRQSGPLELIRVSNDKTHFVTGRSDNRFVIWGVNYDHDDAGRLLE